MRLSVVEVLNTGHPIESVSGLKQKEVEDGNPKEPQQLMEER